MRQKESKSKKWTHRAGLALAMSLIMAATPISDALAGCLGAVWKPAGEIAAELNTVRAAGIDITENKGYNEGAYVKWRPVEGANGYTVSVSKDQSTWTLLDDQLTRQYADYYRADALGLAAGAWYLKVEAGEYDRSGKKNSALGEAVAKVEVAKHDRSGYAFVKGTASGAYKEDGSLRENTVVLYVTNENKDKITMDVVTGDNGATTSCKGLQKILEGYRSHKETRNLCIRLIGRIDDPAVLTNGDLLVDTGLDNSLGVTIEGVGDDAVINGWGLQLEGCSNVEIRNVAVMNCDSGEGDNFSLVKNNDHIWIHNCDSFYGEAGTDEDQKKGDGAMDCKQSTYITFSYNHFWDNGKCCLLGLEEGDSYEGYITYHHNWFDHSDSRHPRVRYYTAHVYNNYYDGNAKYGIGSTLGSSIFAENNFFRNCKKPMLISLQGTDIVGGGKGTFSDESGGVIKAYGNLMEGSYTFVPYGSGDGADAAEFDAYVAKSRDEKVPATVVSNKKGGTFSTDHTSARHTYNNFDTAEGFYEYQVDTADQVPDIVKAKAGRVNGGDFKFAFKDSVDDASDVVHTALKEQCRNYTSGVVTVGGIAANPTVPAFEVTFDPGNGEAAWTEKVIINGALADPGKPEKNPESLPQFDGWFYQDKKWDFTGTVTTDMTFTGKWLPEYGKPTVYGSVPIGAQTVKYVIVTSENSPDRVKDTPYFVVMGEHKKENGTSATYKDANGENASYYGRYRLLADNKMSVSFQTTRKSKLVLFLDVTNTTKKLEVDGTKLTAVNSIIETTIEPGSHEIKAVSGSSAQLYAIWVLPEVSSYNVAVDKGDGSEPTVSTVPVGGQVEQSILPKLPEQDDKEFLFWVDDSGKEVVFPYTPVDDVTFRAIWKERDHTGKTYSITVDLAGGTAENLQSPISIAGLGTLTPEMLPAAPVRPGFVFDGWVDENGQPIQWPVTVKRNRVITAVWKKAAEGFNPAYEEVNLAVVLADSESGRYVYTGKAITPGVVVYNYGRKLTEGVDYTVKYSNNIKAAGKEDKSAPKITVTGKGNLTGSAFMTFAIEPKNLADADVVKGTITVASGTKAVPVLLYNGERLSTKDYAVTEAPAGEKYSESGIMKVKGTGNYSGELELNITVVQDKSALKKFTVEMGKDVLTYNGALQFPGFAVKDGSQTLILGTDYALSFSEAACTNAGTAKLTIVGMNSYSGSVTKSYKINPIKATGSEMTVSFDEPADGYAYTPAGVTVDREANHWSVTYKKGELAENLIAGKDYKVTYSGNKKVGRATVKLAFLGNYKGSRAVSKNFTVKAAVLSGSTAEVVVPDKVYAKPAFYKSVPIVTVSHTALKSSDYIIGSYEYKYKADYEKDLADGNGESGWKTMDNSNKLTLDQDDAVVRVKIAGKGNFTADTQDPLYGYYRVCRKSDTAIDISKAKVTFYADAEMKQEVKKLPFTGKPVVPGAVKVEVKAGGNNITLEADQFTVVYTNNVSKGKLTAVVTGNGLATGKTNSSGAPENLYTFVGSKNATLTIETQKLTDKVFDRVSAAGTQMLELLVPVNG